MNVDQIINMVMRIVGRRLIGRGINQGIDLVARRGRKAEDMTPKEKQQAQTGKQMAKRVRQMSKLTRRM